MDVKAFKLKLDELKALFILGQRVLPFMEELFEFIEETQPLLDDINNAIKENLKKMPNASKQLSKVTQATEVASTEIMDTVDRVNDNLYKVINELEEFRSYQEQLFNNPITLLETIAEGISAGKDLTPHLKDVQHFISRVKEIKDKEHNQVIVNIINEVKNITDDANSIINSLQIQDITAQQLAAVNHLLENVQCRLTGIMKNINTEESNHQMSPHKSKFDESMRISTLHRSIAFDPDAVDSVTTPNRQDDIDVMFSNPNLVCDETENVDAVVDPDDIISSFNAANLEEESMDEEFSQDDIDAMFN